MKTVSVVLTLCLNIGTLPPDRPAVVKQGTTICWLDPTQTSRSKARELIGQGEEEGRSSTLTLRFAPTNQTHNYIISTLITQHVNTYPSQPSSFST